MTVKKIFQSRGFLLLFCLIPLLFSMKHYYSKKSFYSASSDSPSRTFAIDINEREKLNLSVFNGYEYPQQRYRALTKVISVLKLCQSCRENPNSTVLDIGASLGEFSFRMAACGCQVYMFEIQPTKVLCIRKTIEINRLESRVHLINKAVSDSKPNVHLYFSRKTSGQVSLFDPRSSSKAGKSDIYVGETTNLNSDLLPLQSILLIRIDVQGFELHALRSAEKFFRQRIVTHLIFEYTASAAIKHVHRDLFHYIKHILGGKQFYALHPKQEAIYGPMTDNDIDQFYIQHRQQSLQRDIYVSFRENAPIISTAPYNFNSSF